MSKKLRELQSRKATLVADARKLTDTAAAENRDLSDDESSRFDGLKAQIDSTNKLISAEEFLNSQELNAGTVTHFGEAARVDSVIEQSPSHGFKSFGEFAQAVIAGSARNANVDERLMIGAAAPGTYGSEGVGQDGGFLIPPQYATEIFTLSQTEDSLLPLTDNTEVSGNSMVFPKDETVPWGTDGVRAYWQAEAGLATATKPKLGTTTNRLHKLMALVPLTDELMADASALQSYLPGKVADSIRWKTNEALLFGTGAGQPIGAYNSQAAITVVKESGQATLTLDPKNLAKMISRLPPGSYGRGVWLINNDVLPALFTLTLGNYPIYLPGDGAVGGIQTNPYGTLLGRPIMVSQHANTFSSQGDILLADMSFYRTITKAGGIQTDTSMHIYFDADATAFRAIFRVDGAPKILNPISPAKGANTMSPFVQLGAR